MQQLDNENADMFDICEYVEELEEDYIGLVDGMMYLGTIFKPNRSTNYDLLLEKRIHVELLFMYPFQLVYEYGYCYPLENYFTNRIEIVKLRVVDDCYFVIIKTFWLREFQRRWKKIYKKRKQWVDSIRRNPVKYLDSIQRTGLFIERH